MKPYSLLFLFCFLVQGCTTVRPLTASEMRLRDTLVMKPVVINQPANPVVNARLEIIHDTLIIRETIKQSVPFLDTALLSDFFNRHRTDESLSFDEMQKQLLLIQALVLHTRKSDSQRVVMQRELDTTKGRNQIAQRQIEASRVVMYQVPLYFYFFVVLVAIGVLLYYKYMKRKLRKKQDLYTDHQNTY